MVTYGRISKILGVPESTIGSMEFRAAIYMSFEKTQCIICFKIKNPPPVELCWQKKRNP
jgi:hypothetical protein